MSSEITWRIAAATRIYHLVKLINICRSPRFVFCTGQTGKQNVDGRNHTISYETLMIANPCHPSRNTIFALNLLGRHSRGGFQLVLLLTLPF